MSDAINPSHYKDKKIGGRECIELTHLMTFSAGNCVKYLWRAGDKPGEAAEKDISKALRYLEFLIDSHERTWTSHFAPDWYVIWKLRAERGGHEFLVDIIDLMTFGLYRQAHEELSAFALTLTVSTDEK